MLRVRVGLSVNKRRLERAFTMSQVQGSVRSAQPRITRACICRNQPVSALNAACLHDPRKEKKNSFKQNLMYYLDVGCTTWNRECAHVRCLETSVTIKEPAQHK